MKPDMTEDEKRACEAFAACRDVRLPGGFADRLVKSVRDKGVKKESSTLKTTFMGAVLIAASLTMVLGFVPLALQTESAPRPAAVARCAEIRAAAVPTNPEDSRLSRLAFLGLCREMVRNSSRALLRLFRRHEDEDAED